MLKVRIIPTLLWKNYSLVKGTKFDNWRQVGAVMPSIKIYNLRDVDELILIDIKASNEGREPRYDLVEEYTAECSVPLTYGGGVKSMDEIRKLLLAGVEKILINSASYVDIGLIDQAARKFGSQCIVAGIDYRIISDGSIICFSQLGSSKSDLDVVVRAKQLESMGAGELLLTSIDGDGLMCGYDCNTIRMVSENINLPIIASGGAGSYSHMLDALRSGASAVAASSMFHFTEQTPQDAKVFLGNNGIPVRLGI